MDVQFWVIETYYCSAKKRIIIKWTILLHYFGKTFSTNNLIFGLSQKPGWG